MKTRVIVLAFTAVLFMTIESSPLRAQDARAGHGQPEPPMAGIHWARGDKPEAPGNGQGAGGLGGKPVKSPNLTPHGGPIMDTVKTTAIFWGPKWETSFAGDKITGIDTFYGGIGNTPFAHTSSEYYQNPNGIYTYVGDDIQYSGHVVDTSTVPRIGNQTSPILTEVCKMIASPVSNGYYPVYVDSPRGGQGLFCAWHSFGNCGDVPVQFAFFFDLDGDAGCDPQDESGLHSQGLAALANVSAHEISEARTDPRLNAWFDLSGEENADKCAWVFPTPLLKFKNGSKWKLQGNWSNAAYLDLSRGYTNRSGEKGCIDGGTYM